MIVAHTSFIRYMCVCMYIFYYFFVTIFWKGKMSDASRDKQFQLAKSNGCRFVSSHWLTMVCDIHVIMYIINHLDIPSNSVHSQVIERVRSPIHVIMILIDHWYELCHTQYMCVAVLL